MKQYQSESIKEISKSFVKMQGELDNVKKGVSNTFYKSKYADLAACIDAAKDILCKNGLSVSQVHDFDENGKLFLITTLLHESGEFFRGYYPINPVKQDPQGEGSAGTYARRYAFCAIIGLASEDDDGNAASGVHAKPLFKNAALRKAYCDNAFSAFERAETVSELAEVYKQYYPKIKEMEDSEEEYDNLAAEEIIKRKDICKLKLQNDTNYNQQLEDFAERK